MSYWGTLNSLTEEGAHFRDSIQNRSGVALSKEDIQNRAFSELTFHGLFNQTDRCDGSSCMVNKIAMHRKYQREPRYQSYLLNKFMDLLKDQVTKLRYGPVENLHLEYVLVNVHKVKSGCDGFFVRSLDERAEEKLADARTKAQWPHLIHVEVITEHSDCEYCNALVYLDPVKEMAFYLTVCDEHRMVELVPWQTMAAKIVPNMSLKSIKALNTPEENPFNVLLWLHGCLTWSDDTKNVNVLTTLTELSALSVPERTVLGAAMFELYMVETILPKEHAELIKRLTEYSQNRITRITDPTHAIYFNSTG